MCYTYCVSVGLVAVGCGDGGSNTASRSKALLRWVK